MSIRHKMTGLDPSEKIELISNTVLGLLHRTAGGTLGPSAIARHIDYSAVAMKCKSGWPYKSMQSLLEKGYITYERYVGYTITQAGKNFYLGDRQVEETAPPQRSGNLSEVLDALVKKMSLTYPDLASQLATEFYVERVSGFTVTLSFLNSVNMDLLDVWAVKTIDRVSREVYGRKLNLVVKEEVRGEEGEAAPEVAKPESALTKPEMLLRAMKDILGKDVVESTCGINMIVDGFVIGIRKPHPFELDAAKE